LLNFFVLFGHLFFISSSFGGALAKLVDTPISGRKLNVHFKHQEHSLSCEASALTMVLNFHGVKVEEKDIIKKMPIDKTTKTKKVWGDPDIGFVGKVDGVSMKTGYGIHWRAMAKIASHWKKAKSFENSSLKFLISNILKSRPTIIWVYDGKGTPVYWQTPQGKKVRAIEDEHTVIVYGFEGMNLNPTGFYIMDPEHGPTFWDIDKINKLWESSNRSGIVL
jgi:uncharacterized protein YvpB